MALDLLEEASMSREEAIGASLVVEDATGYRAVVARLVEARAENGRVRIVLEARTLSREAREHLRFTDRYIVLVGKPANYG